MEEVKHSERVGADLATLATSMFKQPVRLEVRTEQNEGRVLQVVFVPKAVPLDMPVYRKAQGPPGVLVGSGPVNGRAQVGGQLAAPGTAGAGISSNPDSLSSNLIGLTSNLAGLSGNLTALGCNLPSRDELLHKPWR